MRPGSRSGSGSGPAPKDGGEWGEGRAVDHPTISRDHREVAAPILASVYESVLYAEDLPATADFYRDVLGLRLVDEIDALAFAFRLPDGAVLLIFDPRRSSTPGRPAPSHGARGAGHLAFRVDPSHFEPWRHHLLGAGVTIERESVSETQGQLYFRDPAGNSVELVAGELWPE